MKEITRIVIKGSSGYVPVDYAYNDKVTITPESIAYEYKPYCETEENPARKWKYTSNSPEFREQFKLIAGEIREVLASQPDDMITDMSTAIFEITYSDKTKYKERAILFGDWYHELFMDIKMMVPFTEMTPQTLLTEEDYEDVEELEGKIRS